MEYVMSQATSCEQNQRKRRHMGRNQQGHVDEVIHTRLPPCASDAGRGALRLNVWPSGFHLCSYSFLSPVPPFGMKNLPCATITGDYIIFIVFYFIFVDVIAKSLP